MEAWWASLENGEAEGSRALLKRAARPHEAVTFLKKKMQPLKIDAKRVKGLLAQLGSAQEAVWKKAFAELEYFDPRLAIGLEDLMADVSTAPARQRLVEVLSGLKSGVLDGKQVRLNRLDGAEGFNFVAEGSWWAEHRVRRLNSTSWNNPKKKWTRAIRAIALLEDIGSAEAIALLKGLATGHADAQPTRQAKQALARFGGKKAR
jgi:hypothetical protein